MRAPLHEMKRTTEYTAPRPQLGKTSARSRSRTREAGYRNSALSQTYRSIAGVNRQQISSAINLAVNIIPANPALSNDNGDVQIDVSIARVQINICCQIFRYFQRYRTIPAFQSPAGSQSRAGSCPGVHMPVASLQLQFIKPATHSNMSITGGSPELAIHAIQFLCAIAAAQ